MMLSRKPILLVGGEGKEGSFARLALNEAGLGEDIVQSATAPEALNYLRGCYTERPRVVLLDVGNVDREGLDTLRAIKGDEELRSIPVVVFGPSDDRRTVDESFDLGAAGYMGTSVDPAAFTWALRTVCEYWSLSELPK